MNVHETIIIGGGPAGLTAGLYAARAQIDTVLLEQLSAGGQMTVTELIENYPGFPEGVMGADLGIAMQQQAQKFGLKIQPATVNAIRIEGDLKIIETDREELAAKTVILASGAKPKMIGIPNEDRLFGRGVSTCATCDGPLYREKTVGVIGGGDSAIQESLFLAKFVDKCIIFHRRNELRAVKVLQERAFATPQIEFVWNALPQEVIGEDTVEGLRYRDKISGELAERKLDGLFIFIGLLPRSELVKELADLDQNGFVITDQNMETRTPGLYAVGDIRSKKLRQISTAVGDGATAAFDMEKYLS